MWMKIVAYTAGIGVVSELLYQIYLKYQAIKGKQRRHKNELTEVLFFPDKEVACKNFFTSRHGCEKDQCQFSHAENSLSRLFNVLLSAKTTLDVCVFVITCADLADLLIQVSNSGVCVRVITDDEQVDVAGSKIWKLRSQGIAVRTDESSFFMHHKFAIVDGHLLVNGSFNWTRQAITGNQENLLITNNYILITKYQKEFQRLWSLFDPKNSYVAKKA